MGVFDSFGISWGDPLEQLPAEKIAGYYRRVAKKIESVVGEGNSLAAIFLLHWLDGKGVEKTFSPRFLLPLPEVNSYLLRSVRPVFLTQQKVRYKTQDKEFWGGIVPRIKAALSGQGPDPRDQAGNYPMMYEGPFLEPVSLLTFANIMRKYESGASISEREKRRLDVFTSLHSFGVQSSVVVDAKPAPGVAFTNRRNELRLSVYNVEFRSWKSRVVDRYDWNDRLSFPVPNPDFESTNPDAVAPRQRIVVVKHAHARKIEDAGMAQPFPQKSDEWDVTDPQVMAPAKVNIDKSID